MYLGTYVTASEETKYFCLLVGSESITTKLGGYIHIILEDHYVLD